MSDSQGKKFRTNKGGGGEQNGFNTARVLPPKPENDQRRKYKQTANEIIKKFLQSGHTNMTLDVMPREQRKVMHDVAQYNGLITRSQGKEPDRYIILSLREQKLTRSSLVSTDPINPSPKCISAVTSFNAKNPITKDEMNRFLTEKHSKRYQPGNSSSKDKKAVPPKSCCSKEIQKTKEQLPASKYKQRVLKSIEECNVVIISGGTGCGKTTQVPQFILEDAYDNKKSVRIMVTQPRRIAAISISERVAKERGEPLGSTVGYQVRLESRQGPQTLLTYCTTGVLLRMLTSDPIASGITHIIMDEIHEREINTDYLLIALRECLKKRPDLKVILMSATIEGNMQLFTKYFGEHKVDVIRIESRTFDVKIFYLDQILAMSGYQPPESQVFFSACDFNPNEWKEELKAIDEEANERKNMDFMMQHKMDTISTPISPELSMMPMYGNSTYESMHLEPNGMPYYDLNEKPLYYEENGLCLNTEDYPVREWISGPYSTSDGSIIDEHTMNQFMRIVGSPDLRPVITVEFRPNEQDSVFVNGCQYTANPNQSPGTLLKQKVDRALMPDWPLIYHCKQPVFNNPTTMATPAMYPPIDVSQPPPSLLPSILPLNPSTVVPEQIKTPSNASSGLAKFSTEDFGGFGEKQRLAQLLEKKFREELKTTLSERTIYYHPRMNDQVDQTDFEKLRFAEKYDLFCGGSYENAIDHDLLNHVIHYLADSPVFGSILVFLPGFDDIQFMTKKIQSWKKLSNMTDVQVLQLHSQMQSKNHADVFKPVSRNTRKIILATNIAEASITIEDVIFVVDTGKVKEKSFDHESKLSSLDVKLIAKSNADQRAGRAGRVTNGYCIRLYSEKRFNNMPETQVAEMKRAAIYDVTLHAKLFAPNKMKILDFLSLAPEPPEEESVIQSITFLEQIGAFYTPNKCSNQMNDDEIGQAEDPELTDLGKLMARLPLDPQLSRMLLFGLSLKCLTPIINLVALLASREPYVLATSDQRETQSKRKYEMALQDFSDHLMYIRLCTEFCSKNNHSQQKEFCQENVLNFTTMKMVEGTREQLLRELARANLITIPRSGGVKAVLHDRNFNEHSNSWAMVQAAIAAGCYPSVGVSSTGTFLKKVQTFNDKTAGLHPSSILKKQVVKLSKQVSPGPCLEYVVFQELCQMTSDKSLSMKTVTAIPAITALIFTGPIRLNQQTIEEHGIVYEEGKESSLEEKPSAFGANICSLNLDEWYSVKSDRTTLRHFLRLRHKFMHFFLKGIADPSSFGQATTSSQKEMLECIRHLLEAEHTRHNYSPVHMPKFSLRNYSIHDNPDRRNIVSNKSLEQTANKLGIDLRTSSSNSSAQPNQRSQTNQPRQKTFSKNQATSTQNSLFNTSLPLFNVPPPNGSGSNAIFGSPQNLNSSIQNQCSVIFPPSQSSFQYSYGRARQHPQMWGPNVHSQPMNRNNNGLQSGHINLYQNGQNGHQNVYHNGYHHNEHQNRQNQQHQMEQQAQSFGNLNQRQPMHMGGGFAPRGGRGGANGGPKTLHNNGRGGMNNFQRPHGK